MTSKRTCPICGSEVDRETAFCPVCKADLNALPAEMFPLEQEPEPQKTAPRDDGIDLDSPIPEWMQKRFQNKGKSSSGKIDYKSYEDALFGSAETPAPVKPARPSRRTPKSVPAPAVYQPPLNIDAPLVESNETSEEKSAADDPTPADFKNERPARKWDDPESAEALSNQIGEEFPHIEEDYSDYEMPRVESDDSNEQKNAPEDDPALLKSVSPTKVRDAARYLDRDGRVVRSKNSSSFSASAPAAPADNGKLDVAEDSLLGDLLKSMDDDNKPEESKAPETVFFSGNEGQEEEETEAPAVTDIDLTGADANSAAALDRILRGIGYHAEGETAPAAEPAPEPAPAAVEPAPVQETETEPEPDPETPVEQSGGEPSEEVPAEPDPVEELPVQVKDDDSDELDIPWDLFGSADMDMPRSPEDPAYSTFSRKGIPSDPGSNEYQQRMLSSVLKRIINAETFIRPQRKPNGRSISLAARILWAVLAVGGVLLILLTDLTDRLVLDADTELSESAAAFVDSISDAETALVAVDYTAAYSAVLDAPAGKLLASLRDNGARINAVVLDPAAMPAADQLFGNDDTEWWPAGTLSIRLRAGEGTLPKDVYLITANASSVRNWAEQLSAAGEGIRLHVMSAGQLEPVTDVYLSAGMAADAMTDRDDLNIYGGSSASNNRADFAVLYLAVLPFLAWFGGSIAKFLRKDPERSRRAAAPAAGSFGASAPEKEAEHEY